MGGSLKFEEIRDYLPIINNPNFFVETGTYKAVTTMEMAKHFKIVFTTEINKKLYEESKEKAKEIKNIGFLLGDSVKLLDNIMPKVKDGAVFFLDAHQSGSDTSNNGVKHVPLFEELDTILKYDLGPSLFIIDDYRLFNKFWDWEGITVSSILKKFEEKRKVTSNFVENDRLYIVS